MRAKIYLVMILILAMVLSVSFAEEEFTVSGRVSAECYADQALEQNYGITQLLQEYFIRTVEEKDSNIFIVRYEGMENYAYVLGRYEVTVDRNQIVGITWSHDGENTSGGFDAEAWGAEQEIILSKEEKECEEVRKKSSLSIDKMTDIARHAVALLYDLPPEREQALENIVDEEEQPTWFTMYESEPCYTVCLALDDKEEDDILPNGIKYTEKEGNYWVYVNVQTGVIEEISYSAAIGGNG